MNQERMKTARKLQKQKLVNLVLSGCVVAQCAIRGAAADTEGRLHWERGGLSWQALKCVYV